MDTSRTNHNAVSNGSEWQTAGKGKSVKPKQKQQPAIENNFSNGQASNGVQQKSGDHVSGYHNGTSFNGGGSKRGVGRQSSAGSYGGKTNQNTNTQFNRATSSKEDALNKRKLLEKEAKNISKRDNALENCGKSFEEEIAAAKDRIRQTFDDIRSRINERERFLLEELDACKSNGIQMLRQQEQRAKELKEGAANASTMNDRQLDDLRNQIRRFMSDHRFEDEVGKAGRFRSDPERLLELLKNFGEVIPIGGGNIINDSQKHSSMSSLVSSADGDGIGTGKTVSEIAVGGIKMKSDSMDADQLVELTRSLRENLKLQGIAEDILPDICGATVLVPPRRRPPSQSQSYTGGRGGGANRNGGFQRR